MRRRLAADGAWLIIDGAKILRLEPGWTGDFDLPEKWAIHYDDGARLEVDGNKSTLVHPCGRTQTFIQS